MNAPPQELPLGVLIVDLEGPELSPEEREILAHPLVGGVILFTRNYDSPPQVRALVDQIHQIRTPSLAVCVDQEGGAVQRFRDGFTPLPAASILGGLYRGDKEAAYRACSLMGWLMASELRAVGIDLSFAPVVDLGRDVSEIIDTRAFHREPFAVSELASRYIAGMHQAGMKSVIKHFPGHGYAREDSHQELPVDSRAFPEIQSEDLVPFEHLGGAYGEGLMTAHIRYPKVDQAPATFSHKWLQHVLRDQIGFSGVVFSDDLDMQGARRYAPAIADRMHAAFQAGCDVLLLCNNRPEVAEALDQLGEHRNPVASMRLFRMRSVGEAPPLEVLRQTAQWKEAAKLAAHYTGLGELDDS